MFAEQVFWVSFIVVFYVYFGYPLLLAVWRKVGRRKIEKSYSEPSVSLLIAAYNERESLERKIINCLEMNYPRQQLQIIVSLDGPTDGTEAVAMRYVDRGIDTLYCPKHRGKAAALNCAARLARGEILVFADARQRLDANAVRELVANFSDKWVGAVTGELFLMDEEEKEASDGVGLYWRYEKKVRALESEIHSVVGVTGAIYAIRRELFRPLPEDTILDDVAIPMRIVLSGWRAVFEPDARAYDRVASSPEAEYTRKVRTLMGNYQLLAQTPALLIPWRNPVFIQFLSHKVGRLVVPYFLTALLISNMFLTDGFYLILFWLQGAWYLLVCLGLAISRAGILGRPPAPFTESWRQKA